MPKSCIKNVNDHFLDNKLFDAFTIFESLQFPDFIRDLPNYGRKIFVADSILTP